MEKIIELKNWLKTAAIEIRLLKNTYKEGQRQRYFACGWSTPLGKHWSKTIMDLNKLRWEYRHKHIAYSELRGRTRAQIEASYPYENPPEYAIRYTPLEKWIDEIKNEYGQKQMTAQ